MAHRRLSGALFREVMAAGAAALERHKEEINALNVFPVPDGDTGTNMALTVSAAFRETGSDPQFSLADVAQRASRGALFGARGNSGVILSQFLRGFAHGIGRQESVDGRGLAAALAQATATAYRAVIKPVEGTMLTVGKGASDAANRAALGGADLVEVLEAAVEGAREALAKTPKLLPILARAGVVDAGGQGLVRFLEGALAAVRGEYRQAPPSPLPGKAILASEAPGSKPADQFGAIAHEAVTFRYCTEFLVRGRHLPIESIKAELKDLGDSLLVVGDPELVKVHVHTNNPGRALEIGTRYGELLNVSVSNMQEQNRHAAQRALGAEPNPAANGQLKRIGVVAVVQGEGWQQLLASLGVDQLVSGGQTMNPSAAELVTAIEAVPAKEVVVLPNNRNVVFAARQAAELAGPGRRVHVVATRTAADAVAAMMAYNPEGDPEDVVPGMEESAKRVRIAEITRAVRESQAWELPVQAGDFIAIVDGEVRAVGSTAEQAALAILREMAGEDATLISVYYGDKVTPDAAKALAHQVRENWAHCEVEVYGGGQPVYAYVLSVE